MPFTTSINYYTICIRRRNMLTDPPPKVLTQRTLFKNQLSHSVFVFVVGEYKTVICKISAEDFWRGVGLKVL